MAKVLIPLADGVEEMEAVCIIDVLRRAGWTVDAAGVGGSAPVTASRGVRLLPDLAWQAARLSTYDLLVLPGGGGGTRILSTFAPVLDAIRDFLGRGRVVGAICAAPLVLQAAGVLDGRRFTSFPGVADQLRSGTREDRRVVEDGNIVTSQGPGTAVEFALALIRRVDGDEAASKVAAGLIL